jgi:hypothetical protein
MHHVAKVTFGKLENRPYHAECVCGTAGDFSDHGEARNYLAMHLARLQGINSAEFVDATVSPVPIPAQEPEKAPEEVKQPEKEEPAEEEPQPAAKKKSKAAEE